MSLTDLISQRDALARKQAELEKAIAEAQLETRKSVLEEIRRLMGLNGITIADLNTNPRGRPRKNTDHSNAGSKVAPKFRDPDTGATWSGRGLKPRWLSAALESGKELRDFAIDPEAE